MDFFTELRDKTMEELTLFAPITPMRLPSDSKGIAIRPTPSSNDSWQLDGAHTYLFGVQVLVRSDSWGEAWTTINKIHDLWNGADKSFIEGLTFMQATTGPNWVSRDEHNRHEYTALYQAELERGRN